MALDPSMFTNAQQSGSNARVLSATGIISCMKGEYMYLVSILLFTNCCVNISGSFLTDRQVVAARWKENVRNFTELLGKQSVSREPGVSESSRPQTESQVTSNIQQYYRAKSRARLVCKHTF